MDWGFILKLLKYWDGSEYIFGFPIGGRGYHGLLDPMRYSFSMSSPIPWNIAFRPGKEGHELVAWFSSQKLHSSTEFDGHSLYGCFFLHIGKNMAIVLSNSICFYFTCSVSICADRVLKISVLMLSNRFPIFSFMKPPPDTFVDQIPWLFLATPLEH